VKRLEETVNEKAEKALANTENIFADSRSTLEVPITIP
jgi:hypothetical protein